MKKITYFPGCSAHGTAEEFDHSVKLLMHKFEVELQDIPDWNCCGASSAHYLNEELSIALPARNLQNAKPLGNDIIAIPCASCYSRMKNAAVHLSSEETNKEGDNKSNTLPKIESILQYIFDEVGIETIKPMVVRPLSGLKVACYYGCLLTRPTAVTDFDSPEYPVSMDKIITALGAEAVDYDFKTECCGASYSIAATDVVYELTGKIINNALEAGANVIAVACPLCQSNLDMRQKVSGKLMHKEFNIPVVYFTQLMGLSFGYTPEELEFSKNFVPVNIIDKLVPQNSAVPQK
jgi:heterodisulfide reductase subunit B2